MRYLTLAFALMLAATAAEAAVPARLPVQGFLTDGANPVDGTIQIQFQLYAAATGGTALYSETQSVVVTEGDFTVYVGASVPLDMKLFRSGVAFVGVTVANETEMSPRLELGTVPYAAFAQETAAVPPGAVMMFDLDDCPAGWSVLDGARGRALVGVPAGGARGGTVGTALANLEDRAHVHTVDPVSTTSSAGGSHNHIVDVPSFSTTAAGSHAHPWGQWDNARKAWSTFNSAGSSIEVIDWTTRGGDIGMDTVGGGNHPFSVDDTIPLGTQTFFTTAAGSHTHISNPPTATSSTVASHTHAVDVPATTSTAATTGSVMPYLQLLVCKKD